MTPPEERLERSGKDRRADHCADHEGRCELHKMLVDDHKELAEDVYSVRDEVMSVRAERKTEKYFYGIIGSIILLILGILQWSFNDNLTLIRTDLTSIKAFVATGSVADATQMMEISTLKQRIGDIEQELLRGRR